VPYSTPPTFVAAATLAAADLNTLGDDIAYLYDKAVTNPPWHGARAYRNTNLSVADSARTLVTLDNEGFDTDSFHSNVTNSSRMTVPSGLVGSGTAAVMLTGYVAWATNGTGFREIRILHNGVANPQVTDTFGAATTPGQNVTFITSAVANDYFEIDAWQNSGGSINITGAAFALIVIGNQ
jgi:hypothetical protein